MAKETNLTDPVFLGTDHQFRFHVKNDGETASVDITGYALSFMIKADFGDADASALVTVTTAGGGVAISGTYNATPASNTQRATATVADTATDALAEGTRHYELKRTDAGLETVLAYGTVILQRGVHRT